MNHLTLLIKPASSRCNLRCRYCFYKDVASHRQQEDLGRMTEETARRVISEAFRTVSPGGSITFLFQGGEPTLAGLDYFRTFLLLEKEYQRSGIACYHSIQTNGMVLDEAWAAFFREHRFLVGLSLDGTEFVHDQFRLNGKGEGTWQRAVAALRLLERYQVETNLLCVVTGQAARKPAQLYRSLNGFRGHALHFNPCMDPMEETGKARDYSLTPEGYGKFLCQVFDCWYRDWKAGKYVSIRCFDDYLSHLLRMPPSSCAASGSCGHYLVVEGDGSLYPCDYYVLDAWRMGNIHTTTIPEALDSPMSRKFLEEGRKRPKSCASCPYAPLCRGGCKRDWRPDGENRYCGAYQTFFPYAIGRLEEMASAYLRGYKG